jgi:peptidoglycan/xylan/chitin deacetylase (PgdA/CDA1 family)
MLRLATAMMSPAGERGRLSAFIFHRSPEKPDPLLPSEPDARMLDRLLGWIGAQFQVLDPLDACERLRAGTLPARAAIITFDDGYRDNYTVALPMLQRHRMPAAFFIATAYLEGGMMFNDRVIEAIRVCRRSDIELPGDEFTRFPLRDDAERRVAIDRILRAIKHLDPEQRLSAVEELEQRAEMTRDAGAPMMMNLKQLAALHRAGMTIGGHTRSHPILLKLQPEDARAEIEQGLADLASIIGERPRVFAYPNGRRNMDYDASHVAMLEQAGVESAFTTHAGAADSRTAPLEIPRFTPWDRTRVRFGARAWLNLRRH